MNVETTKLPESRVALKIEMSAQEVDLALDRTYKQLVQRVSIPGFRKGKAPRAVLERMVGPEWFLHEATDEAVRWAYRKAIDQEHLVPIDEAEINAGDDSDHVHLHAGEAFQFEATVSVRPDVQLPDYSGLHVDRTPVDVPDDEVDEVLKTIQENHATLEPVARPARFGDNITVNLVARVDGDEVINNEAAEYDLRDEEQDGPDPVLPGLSAQLVGSSPGDIREPVLTLPEEFTPEELAGKSVFVRALVKEVKRRVLPELDDEFAQTVSAFQTLNDLKDAVRANLESEHRMENEERLVREVVEAVTSRTFVEIPPVLIEEELDRMLGEMRDMLESRHLGWQQYLDAAGRKESDIRNDMRETAVANVKQSLVLGAVADREGIDVTNREVNATLDELFSEAGTGDAERRRLRNSSGVRATIRNRLRRQRALQRLVQMVAGGEEVSAAVAEAVAEQTAAPAEDAQEIVAVEAAG